MLDLKVEVDILKSTVAKIIVHTNELEQLRDRVYIVKKQVDAMSFGKTISDQLDEILSSIIQESIVMKQYYKVLEDAIKQYEVTEKKVIEKYIPSKKADKEQKKDKEKEPKGKREKSVWDKACEFGFRLGKGAADSVIAVAEGAADVAGDFKDFFVNFDDIAMADFESFMDDPEEYMRKTKNQKELGNFTKDVTLLGTAESIALSATGFDVAMDVRDLAADIINWNGTKEHIQTTILDATAFSPLTGIFKSADELAALAKNVKRGPDVASAVKNTKKASKVTGEVAENSGDIAKNVAKGAGKAYEGTRNLGADFKNGKKLASHFMGHGEDFGYKTAEDYLAGARNYVMKKPTTTTQSFVSEGGTYFRYDTKTNEFAIVNQYGGISTYFKPENGLEYWIEQVNKYKPK